MGLTKARDVAFLAFSYAASMLAFASNPTQLRNSCVGTSGHDVNALHVNGLTCKNPAEVTPEDFYFKGIDLHDGGGNVQGQNLNATEVDAANLPGLNTLGISMTRSDYGPGGLAQPHLHPRASEVITVLDGTIRVGFIASNKVFAKVLYRGDVFVIPRGLTHFVYNAGKEHAATMAGLSSDNLGLVMVASPALGPNPPPVSVDILDHQGGSS